MSKDVEKWNGLIHNRYWNLQKLPNKIKLFDEQYEYHYRFSLEEWDTIKKQFAAALRKNKLA